MASDTKKRFVRSMRSLDRGEFIAFVVALWAAWGWEPSETGTTVGTIEMRREGRETRSIRVATGLSTWPVIVSLLVWPADTDIVVTRGRLAAIAVARVLDHGSRATFEHVSADDLYTHFRYALADDEQDRLWMEYLGGFENPTASEGSLPSIGLGAVLDRTPSISRITPIASIRTLLGAVVVGSVVVALLVAGITPGPSAVVSLDENPFSAAGTGTTDPRVTPVDVRTPEPAPPETTRMGAVPAVCPPPPADAHPAAIRPGVVETASTSGLEGWLVEFEGNLTDFDPNDESNRVSPAVRHLAVYETPSGRQYRLTIDRWQSVERAADYSTRAERANQRTPLVWGAYSIAVEPYTTKAPKRTAAEIRKLLTNVQTPGGITLGDRCVDALAGDA